MRYPGEYEFMYVLSEASKPIYLALTDAERATIRYEIDETLEDAIDMDQLEHWDFSHNKIAPWSSAYPAESEIRDRLEELVKTLGKNGNTLTIKPNGLELEPAMLGYDKEFDCGRSCHHTYDLYLSSVAHPHPVPWTLSGYSHPLVVFDVRVTLVWIAPPAYHEGEYELPHLESKVAKVLTKKKAAKLSKGASSVRKARKATPRRPVRH